ncbi:MAG: hypothetical protein QM639_09770 [Rhodocyclaceae bacterium]
MTEPASAGGAGYAFAAGTITITGSVMGMHYDALMAGLAGALFALAMSDHQLPPKRLVAWLVTTVMIAAWMAPVIGAWLVSSVPAFAPVDEALRLACAALIGAGAKSLIPALVGRAARTIDGGTPQ